MINVTTSTGCIGALEAVMYTSPRHTFDNLDKAEQTKDKSIVTDMMYGTKCIDVFIKNKTIVFQYTSITYETYDPLRYRVLIKYVFVIKC